MSDYTSIAGCSSTLRLLLLDRMTEVVPITIAPPDVTIDTVTQQRLNLYLFEIQENASLKNQDFSNLGNPRAYGHPPLSLVLHYLITAYGNDDTKEDADLTAQVILGDAMRVFNDFAIVTRDLVTIRHSPLGTSILDPSLQNDPEQVKITLKPSSLEELSKIWTALPNVNFRRSVAYEVSVVQIQSSMLRTLAMPVEVRQIQASLLRGPQISNVYRTPAVGQPIGDQRAAVGQQLTIVGSGFQSTATLVALGTLDPIQLTPVSDTLITINVPDDKYPLGPAHPLPPQIPIPPAQQLQPGIVTVQVLTPSAQDQVAGGLGIGVSSLVPGQRVSNQGVFMLAPQITGTSPSHATASGTLTIDGTRLFIDSSRAAYVMINDVAIPVTWASGDPWLPPSPTSIQVPLQLLGQVNPPLPTGVPFPVRVVVNGSQSTDTGFTFTLDP